MINTSLLITVELMISLIKMEAIDSEWWECLSCDFEYKYNIYLTFRYCHMHIYKTTSALYSRIIDINDIDNTNYIGFIHLLLTFQ